MKSDLKNTVIFIGVFLLLVYVGNYKEESVNSEIFSVQMRLLDYDATQAKIRFEPHYYSESKDVILKWEVGDNIKISDFEPEILIPIGEKYRCKLINGQFEYKFKLDLEKLILRPKFKYLGRGKNELKIGDTVHLRRSSLLGGTDFYFKIKYTGTSYYKTFYEEDTYFKLENDSIEVAIFEQTDSLIHKYSENWILNDNIK